MINQCHKCNNTSSLQVLSRTAKTNKKKRLMRRKVTQNVVIVVIFVTVVEVAQFHYFFNDVTLCC